MKSIYDERTQGLIDQLEEMIGSRVMQLSEAFEKVEQESVIYLTKEESINIVNDPILNKYNQELARIYSIAMPICYEV